MRNNYFTVPFFSLLLTICVKSFMLETYFKCKSIVAKMHTPNIYFCIINMLSD